MGLFDRLLPSTGLVEAITPPDGGAYISGLEESLDAERAQADFVGEENQMLKESLADAQLALEDVGWRRLAGTSQTEFTTDGIKRGAELCRIMAVVNPLIKRAVELRIAYIWGQGVSITAKANGDEASEQDVNAVVQGFLDDAGTKRVLSSAAAHETCERTLSTDGQMFFALYTDPLYGRVQPRSVPLAEVEDIICNPDDRSEPWYYKRTSWGTEILPVGLGAAASREVRRTVYHPAATYQPKSKPRTIDGNLVRWDAPIMHLAVNRLDGWKFGIGDAYAAIPWARAYKDFLEDWLRLAKALSRFAWRAQAKGRNKDQVRAKLSQAPAAQPLTGAPQYAGATYIAPEGQGLEAIPKAGATIDSDSGRPAAAMVASGMGLPVTMLLGDPGVTGARATAETLDTPTERTMEGRQNVWADFLRSLIDYVIDAAIRAPQGALKGGRTVDPVTGQDRWTLKGDADRTILVEFPDLDDETLAVKVQAIATADETGKLPPLEITRQLCDALDIANVDDVIDAMTDDQGNFVDPRVSAGQAAVDAFRQGADPAAQFGGPQTDAEPDPAPAAD